MIDNSGEHDHRAHQRQRQRTKYNIHEHIISIICSGTKISHLDAREGAARAGPVHNYTPSNPSCVGRVAIPHFVVLLARVKRMLGCKLPICGFRGRERALMLGVESAETRGGFRLRKYAETKDNNIEKQNKKTDVRSNSGRKSLNRFAAALSSSSSLQHTSGQTNTPNVSVCTGCKALPGTTLCMP